MKNKNFCHLHIHDEFSLLDGLGTSKEYAKKASELGFEYLALTNHGNVDGCIRFQNACKEHNIQPIIGVELYLVDDINIKEKGETRYHIVALAKNQIGVENIFRMLTIANVNGFYRRPRIDKNILLKYIDGLIIMSACSSSFLLQEDNIFLEQILERINKDFYLEIMPHNYAPQIKINNYCLDLSKKYGINTVATNDCHYIEKSGAELQEVLLAIQTKKKWKDKDRWKFEIDDLYLKTADEMLDSFNLQGVINNRIAQSSLYRTIEIAEKCKTGIIEKKEVKLPKVPGYENIDETELLIELANKGFNNRIKNKSKAYKERLDYEIKLICDLGFQRYFLIVWELISWCKKNDIMCGPGRGSVGASLLAYCLYITDVDPIKYNLIFARFISEARIDLPDIDMDFEDIKRPLIRKHLEDCYGKDNVCGVSTFLTMKGRAALRDVCRVFDVPIIDVNKASKSIVVRSGGDFRSDFCIEDAFNTFEDGIKFLQKYPKQSKLSMGIEGQIRGSGQHAAAMCISQESLKEGKRCNIAIRKNTEVCNWDKYDCEYVGLMKLDVLGLSALTILNYAKKIIKKNRNIDIVFDKIPLDDKKTLSEINSGRNVGAFQIGSLGLMKYCRELGIEKFEDLVHATALWRPGTLRSGMTTEFVNRKRGKTPTTYIHKKLKKITEETFGIILYQEQVMQLMYDLGGLGWKTCDTVRKVISKSQGDELFNKFKDLFIKGCLERKTLTEKDASLVWDSLSSFGSYGFNKAHSVEYSLITYWDMYIKTHFSKEFMCASLTYSGQDKKNELIEECKRLGIEIELPKINHADPHKWLCDKEESKIYIPLLEIKGIGEKTAELISNINLRKNGFFREKNKKINKRVKSILEEIKYFKEELISEEEIEKIKKYFDFDLSKDPMGKYKKIFELLKSKNILSFASDIDFSKPSKENKFYFGSMVDLKFGYRKNVLKTMGKGIGDVKGTATSLGGVYGFFKDVTDSSMLVFENNVYQNKKDKVEHCQGEWAIIKANHSSENNVLFCEDAWFGDDLLSCNLHNINLNLFGKNKFENKFIVDCDEKNCLKEECKKPVINSVGKLNIPIIGEAPGRDEDSKGIGFIGKAGSDILWPELRRYGYSRDLFHITNIVKCYPSLTKTPTLKQIKTCGDKWLIKEINRIKPIITLVFGNTGVKYFKDQNSGIMELSGTTEWNADFGFWICWCIHPAAVLYHRENKILFEKGIKNFCEKIELLGMQK